MHFFVYKYRANLHKHNGNTWTSRLIRNGDAVDYSTIFETYGHEENDVQEELLKAKIFEGKSFWEVEKELAWYDED